MNVVNRLKYTWVTEDVAVKDIFRCLRDITNSMCNKCDLSVYEEFYLPLTARVEQGVLIQNDWRSSS